MGKNGEFKMSVNVYENIMQGLTEAVEYQHGKVKARRTNLTIKPVATFDTDDIKQIRKKNGLSQIMFAGSIGVSPKTVEALENGRNKPEGASRRLFEIVRDDPAFLRRFQAEPV
jgi:putative transcriptional regulator